MLIRPFSRFRRIEAAIDLSGQERVTYSSTSTYRRTLGNDDIPSVKSLVPRLAYVQDNTLWGITGPVNGSRSALEVKYSPAIDFNTYSYSSVVADWRRYTGAWAATTPSPRACGVGRQLRREPGAIPPWAA